MATAKLSEYRKHIADAAARLGQSGILTKSNHGNISARIPDSDTFLLTSVSNLAQITMDNIGLFDLDNNLLDGSVMPISAEIIPMHGIVYKTRPDAGGALHTHSPFATAFAVASKEIPVSLRAHGAFRDDRWSSRRPDTGPAARKSPSSTSSWRSTASTTSAASCWRTTAS